MVCLIGIYDVCNIQLFILGAFRTSGTANSNCMKKGYDHVCVQCFILHWVCKLLVTADWLSSKEFLQCLDRFSFYERWESQHEILDFLALLKGPTKEMRDLFLLYIIGMELKDKDINENCRIISTDGLFIHSKALV